MVNTVFLNRYSAVIAAGLLLRLFLMPFSMQSDIVEHAWIAHFVVQGHIDVYTYYFQKFGTDLFPPDNPHYPAVGFPPMFYLQYAAYLAILQGIHAFTFLNDWSLPFMTMIPSFSEQSRLFFLLKAFFLPFDLLGFLSFLGCLDSKHRTTGAIAWWLNPLILYVTYVWGQTDIIAASLTMAALYFAKRASTTRRFQYGMISCMILGLSASFKLFSLALLPLFSLFMVKHSGKSQLYYWICGLAPFVIVVPFLSKHFLASMSYYSSILSSRNFLLPAGSQFTIYVAYALYLAVILYAYIAETDFSFDILQIFGLAVFSLLYGLSLWLPNWILWALPFLLPILLRRPKLYSVYVLLNVFYFLFVQAFAGKFGYIWLSLFFPLTSFEFYTGLLGTFPSLTQLMPFFPSLGGFAYTGIGTCMFFITYYAWRLQGKFDKTKLGRWTVSSVLLVPILLGSLTLFLGRDKIQEYGFPIWDTLAGRIKEDPTFFSVYFVAVIIIAIWLVLVLLSRNWSKRHRSSRVGAALNH